MKLGSFELDNIYQGDCLELMKEIPDKSIDLILTDPPYGINYYSRQKKIKWDRFKNDDNLKWVKKSFIELNRILKDNSHVYIFSGYKFIDIFLNEFKKEFSFKNIIVIPTRHSGGVINDGHFRHSYEMVLYGHKGTRKFNKMRKHTVKRPNDPRQKNKYLQLYPDLLSMFYANEFNLKQLHPTQKDLNCIKHFIELSSNPNDIILDPFLGSGTTCVAAKLLNRHYLGFELESNYIDIARKRLEQETLSTTLFKEV